MTGNELKGRREALGFSQEKLAREMNNSSTGAIARWEQLKDKEISNKLVDLALQFVEQQIQKKRAK